LNRTSTEPPKADVIVYKEGWHMLTRQLSAQETLEDIANWIQKSPQAQLRNPSQAQQIVCNVQ
jgi:hypothetical protein